MLYFAYGSNMSSQRLQQRTPSAQNIGNAILFGYEMRVHKLSSDGSAKCNAVQTGCADDKLFGVLYQLDDSEMKILDRYESAGIDYANRPVQVLANSGLVVARCYFAFDRTIDDGIKPYDWYMKYVIDGAIEHGLPVDYVNYLEQIKTIRDQRLTSR